MLWPLINQGLSTFIFLIETDKGRPQPTQIAATPSQFYYKNPTVFECFPPERYATETTRNLYQALIVERISLPGLPPKWRHNSCQNAKPYRINCCKRRRPAAHHVEQKSILFPFDALPNSASPPCYPLFLSAW